MLNEGLHLPQPLLQAALPLCDCCGCVGEGWEERPGREDGCVAGGCSGMKHRAQTWPSSNKLPCLCIIVHCSLYFCIKMQRLTVDLEKSATELPPKVFNPPFNNTCPGRSTSSSVGLAVGCCSGSQIRCPALTVCHFREQTAFVILLPRLSVSSVPTAAAKPAPELWEEGVDKLRCKWSWTGLAMAPHHDSQCLHCFSACSLPPQSNVVLSVGRDGKSSTVLGFLWSLLQRRGPSSCWQPETQVVCLFLQTF